MPDGCTRTRSKNRFWSIAFYIIRIPFCLIVCNARASDGFSLSGLFKPEKPKPARIQAVATDDLNTPPGVVENIGWCRRKMRRCMGR